MTDNVIILGAGFSFDAGIPLLGNFVERMWEYATRGRSGEKLLSAEDNEVLNKALDIRRELDGYHGRVSFDDRNLEDILSILAFNVLGGGQKDKNKLTAFANAISTTIELSCNVKHGGFQRDGGFRAITEGSDIYRSFWKSLFKWKDHGNELPAIITFNYDLVLERALLQTLINTYYSGYDARTPFTTVSLDYKYKYFPLDIYKMKYLNYGGYSETKSGSAMEKTDSFAEDTHLNVELLKLHGSLNFPRNAAHLKKEVPTLVNPLNNPYIIPPVSNKQSSTAGDESWRTALNRIQKAKNIVFVGYSLPRTDMYMQFFLKAALGPNQELNRITVFDPTLWNDDSHSKEMRERYESCLAEQQRTRIQFNPPYRSERDAKIAGTAKHFIKVLSGNPNEIMF
ncbi:MAG: SIR2 family protein [Candidatus Sedimenticola sp. (ex Thyasira tokunagai)]